MGMLGVYMLTDENTMNILSDNDNLFEAVENYGEEKTTISYGIDKSSQEPIEGEPLSEAVVGVHVLDCKSFIAYTAPYEIHTIIKALNEVDIDTLITKMNLSKFRKAKIYPNIWVKKNEEQLKKELKQEFFNLKTFYEKALNSQTGVLVSIY